ncbi:MAG: efflux RND transporter permease subunit [Thermoplasmatota archaeon]
MVRPHELVSRAIAGTSLWSSRHAKTVVAVTLFLTIGLGYGITLINTNVDVADVLPRGNPNTAAAQNLTTNFKSTFTQQVTFQLHVDESADYWNRDNALLEYRNLGIPVGNANGNPQAPLPVEPDHLNITDEVYIRAMEEMKLFIQKETDFDRSISISNIYALINWTIAGGQGVAEESAFRLPGYDSPQEASQYLLVDQTVKAIVLDTVDAIVSPSWNHGAMLFMPASDNEEDMRVLGESIIAARDAYVEAVDNGETEFTVFGSHNPPLFTVDFPVANAHSSALVEEDMVKLMPLVAAFIIICLFIAFRNVRAILISFTALGVGVTWTYGTMGYMGIALNTLNMTIVPLIMGVGIDYAIHMINEFLEHKAHGKTDPEAFAEAGRRAGLAMFIATLTTVLGLIVMMVSPSLLMAQLGFLSAVAIAAIYILTITFIPAALTLVGGSDKMGASFSPNQFMPSLAHGVSRARYLVILVVIGLTALAYAGSAALEQEAFGDPGKNFPEDDEIRREHEQGLEYFYEREDPDIKTNILTFEGPGILTPEAIEYYRTIERNMQAPDKDLIIADTLRTVPFFIETWLTVKGGAGCAALNVGAGSAPGALEPVIGAVSGTPLPCSDQVEFPDTHDEIIAEVNTMFSSPMKELASVIVNHPKLNMAALTFAVDAGTYDEAERVWDQVWEAVGQANATFGGSPPPGVNVAFVGNSATNYLFVAEQLPWLGYMSIASSIILFILVLVFTGSPKATIVATATAGLTSLWWLGLLPSMGIGLAITLMLPLVFIFNIGTDYVVHIIWNLKQVERPREVFETTGKAILFSAITTAGAFAFFILIQNVAVSRTMIATTVSIFVIFLATMLMIPAFYKVPSKKEDLEQQEAIAAREAAATAGAEAPAVQPLVAKKRVKSS